MWQRIQTVFLILVVIASIVAYYLPFAGFIDPSISGKEFLLYLGKTIGENPDGTSNIQNHSWLAAINGLISLLTLISIFLFKNRQRQMLLISFTTLLVAGSIVGIFYLADQMSGTLGIENISYKVGGIIPILQILLLNLARRSIKKDDALVRSADRLR